MPGRAVLAVLLLMVLTGMPFAEAQYCDAPNWEGKFYNNVNFTGLPVYNTCNSVINFNWGPGSPASGVNADNFAVRWTTVQTFQAAGNYTFTITVEDGVRFYVNGAPLINSMIDSNGPQTLNGTYTVPSAGATAFLTLEMVNYIGNAQISVTWSLSSGAPLPPSTTSNNTTPPQQQPQNANTVPQSPVNTGGGQPWSIEYFNNPTLEGSPAATAQASADGISRNYSTNPPVSDGSVGADDWSARWKRTVDFPAGTYVFTLRADDGAKVLIDDTVILDQPEFLDGVSFKVNVQIPAGQRVITVEYFDKIEFANLFLTWEPPIGTTLLPDGCNGETAGINGSAAPCPQTTTGSSGTSMTVTVRAGPLFFRPRPSRSSGSISMIHRGEQYTAIGRSADNIWVQLTVNGQQGWSMTEFLTLPQDINSLPITDGSASTSAAPAGDINTVTVEGGTPSANVTPTATIVSNVPLVQAKALGHIRIRAQPSENADRVGGVAWGEVVRVIGRNADSTWIQVEANGVQGWSARAWYEITEGDLTALPITG